MLQVRTSDINLTRTPSAGIAIITAVLLLPQISPDSFMDVQTGACQRLPLLPSSLACLAGHPGLRAAAVLVLRALACRVAYIGARLAPSGVASGGWSG